MLDKKFVIKVCYGGIEEIMPDLRHTLKRVFGEAYASITFQGIGGLH
jgi:hypothetical protein